MSAERGPRAVHRVCPGAPLSPGRADPPVEKAAPPSVEAIIAKAHTQAAAEGTTTAAVLEKLATAHPEDRTRTAYRRWHGSPEALREHYVRRQGRDKAMSRQPPRRRRASAPRQQRFVEEYLLDLNGKQAAHPRRVQSQKRRGAGRADLKNPEGPGRAGRGDGRPRSPCSPHPGYGPARDCPARHVDARALCD